MTSEQTQEYDEAMVAVLEAVWGEGYMSPGGSDEVGMIVEGVALADKSVLDLGCGTGGITRFLAETYRPACIVGIDVDAGLIARATRRASKARLGNSLTFR
jgi:cyclopropane fatty-acyl-phospholipid synthase-like methyltransferase